MSIQFPDLLNLGLLWVVLDFGGSFWFVFGRIGSFHVLQMPWFTKFWVVLDFVGSSGWFHAIDTLINDLETVCCFNLPLRKIPPPHPLQACSEYSHFLLRDYKLLVTKNLNNIIWSKVPRAAFLI